MDIPGMIPFLVHCKSRNESLLDCPDEGRRDAANGWRDARNGGGNFLICFMENAHVFPGPILSMGRLYIYLHEWLIFMVNVGKYTSPMDPMGVGFQVGFAIDEFVIQMSCIYERCGVVGVCQPHQLTSKTPSTSRLDLFPRYMSEENRQFPPQIAMVKEF